jgi:tetratricopeptide (TPR) repeat protein
MYYLKKDSADGRSLMWKIALQTAVKHPFGVGLGNFSGAYGDEQAIYFAGGKGSEQEELVAGSPEYGFNEYLQIAVESGIVSLVLFFAIVFLSLKSFLKNKEYGLAGSMVSLFVFAFFSYPFSILPFLIVFVFLLASSREQFVITKEKPERITTSLRGGTTKQSGMIKLLNYKQFAPAFICFLVTLICLYKIYPTYNAYKKWNTNKLYYNAGLYKDVAKDYQELYPLLNDQIPFLFEYAQSLSKTGIDSSQEMADQVRHDRLKESNEVLQRAMQISCDPMLYNIMGKNYQAMNEYEQAEACFMKAAHIVPNRIYPFYLLTKLYHEMGLQDKVDETAAIVLTKEPKVQSTAVREMREEVLKLRIKN